MNLLQVSGLRVEGNLLFTACGSIEIQTLIALPNQEYMVNLCRGGGPRVLGP